MNENLQSSESEPAQSIEALLPPELTAQTAPVDPEEQRRFLAKYSFGALVLGPLYFAAAKDMPFFWLSLFAGLFPPAIPLLFALAAFARRRAWPRDRNQDFRAFQQAQRR